MNLITVQPGGFVRFGYASANMRLEKNHIAVIRDGTETYEKFPLKDFRFDGVSKWVNPLLEIQHACDGNLKFINALWELGAAYSCLNSVLGFLMLETDMAARETRGISPFKEVRSSMAFNPVKMYYILYAVVCYRDESERQFEIPMYWSGSLPSFKV